MQALKGFWREEKDWDLVSVQPLIIPSPREMRSRDSGLLFDTRIIMGTSDGILWVLQETFFESPPAQEGPSSALFGHSRNLAFPVVADWDTLPQEISWKHGRGVRHEPQSATIPTPHLNQGVATLNPTSHTGGTYSHNGMMEMHPGRYPDSLEFRSCKVNFKTEVCSKTSISYHHYALDQRSLR